MIRIYLAASIFSESDRLYNEILATKIENRCPNVNLYVPQRNKDINDKTKCATAEDITKGDFDNNLDLADLVVARVDGDVPPIGTTLEIGYFCRRCQEEIERTGHTNKRIFSLYTDSREPSKTVNEAKTNMLHQFAESQFSYINLLLVGALKRYGEMFDAMDNLVDELAEYVDFLENSIVKVHQTTQSISVSPKLWAVSPVMDNIPIRPTPFFEERDFQKQIEKMVNDYFSNPINIDNFCNKILNKGKDKTDT